MACEFRQYPAPPPGEHGAPPEGPDPRTDPRFYQVVQHGETVAAYDSAHYDLDAVLGDLFARGAAGDAAGTWGEGYVIWRAGRRLGAIRAWTPRVYPPDAGVAPPPGRIRIADDVREDYRAI